MIEHMFTTLPAHADSTIAEGWQASLFGLDDPSVDTTFPGLERMFLDDESWVDHCPGWLAGADLVFGELVARLPWAQREVVVYDRRLLEPRLTAWWTEGCGRPEALPVLSAARHALSQRYARRFDSIGANYYRDGRDSVAWHADRERRTWVDPVIAVLSLGTPRPFLLRRRGGGPSIQFHLGHGDLFVMGGACQHDWEHSVPKVAQAGPRISLVFRHCGHD